MFEAKNYFWSEEVGNLEREKVSDDGLTLSIQPELFIMIWILSDTQGITIRQAK